MNSKRKIALRILVCFVFGTLSITILFSATKKINDRKNNFVRLLPPHAVIYKGVIDLNVNSYYVAGMTYQNVYLASNTAPRFVLKVDYKHLDTNHILLPDLNENKLLVSKAIRCVIDSPLIYLIDPATKTSFTGDLSGNTLITNNFGKLSINKTLIIPDHTLIYSTYNTVKMKSELLKTSLTNRLSVDAKPFTFDNQMEGFFSVDGMLNYDKEGKKIVFVYYYRNQFVTLDTNLNLLKIHNTIDTNTFSKVKAAYISEDNKLTMAAPPININAGSDVYGKYLFIHSSLQADNENKSDFTGNAAIDIYNLNDGRYKYSFYLPLYKDKKLKSFKVFDKYLIGLYDHYLMVFELNI